MSKLFIAKMLNSGTRDKITDKHPLLKKYCKDNHWLTLDNRLSDKFGTYIRDNNL